MISPVGRTEDSRRLPSGGVGALFAGFRHAIPLHIVMLRAMCVASPRRPGLLPPEILVLAPAAFDETLIHCRQSCTRYRYCTVSDSRSAGAAASAEWKLANGWLWPFAGMSPKTGWRTGRWSSSVRKPLAEGAFSTESVTST